MTTRIDPKRSASQIRRRLYAIMIGALGIGLTLTFVVMIVSVYILFQMDAAAMVEAYQPMTARLATHYAARQGWGEAQQAAENWEWDLTLLLDQNGRILVDNGQAAGARVGQPYALREADASLPIVVAGKQVGTLILLGSGPTFSDYLVTALVPTVLIGALLIGLTLLMSFLLGRSFVNPLADVIAASQAVAGGDLSSRVTARGPDDLRHLIDSFNAMAEALDRNDRERRSLLADIAHELLTPLTVMRGRLEGIVDGVYPNETGIIAPVLNQTYLLERIVGDLRLLTLAEAGQLPFDFRAVQLTEVAARVVGVFEAEAGERDIRLELDIPQAVPPVRADPQRLEQIIGNLISNAIRYIPNGGQVGVRIEPSGQFARVSIQDSGPGVPAQDLPQLFTRFWRAEKSRARSSGGAGLGLAIVKQLVTAHGGDIAARNQERGGLEVTFTLPLMQPLQEKVSRAADSVDSHQK